MLGQGECNFAWFSPLRIDRFFLESRQPAHGPGSVVDQTDRSFGNRPYCGHLSMRDPQFPVEWVALRAKYGAHCCGTAVWYADGRIVPEPTTITAHCAGAPRLQGKNDRSEPGEKTRQVYIRPDQHDNSEVVINHVQPSCGLRRQTSAANHGLWRQAEAERSDLRSI